MRFKWKNAFLTHADDEYICFSTNFIISLFKINREIPQSESMLKTYVDVQLAIKQVKICYF